MMPFTPPTVASGGTVKAADINLLGTQYSAVMADIQQVKLLASTDPLPSSPSAPLIIVRMTT